MNQTTTDLPTNVIYSVTWSMAVAARGLALATVEVASGTKTQLDYHPDLTLRCRATDSVGETGAWSESREFEAGNRAPELTILSSPERATRDVVTELVLTDPAGDLGGIEMCFVLLDEDPATCHMADGSSTGSVLLASPEGTVTQAVWRSQTDPNPDSTVPQGIGPANTGAVELRLRAFDQAAGEKQAGAWRSLFWPELINDTAPQVRLRRTS